MKCTAFQIAAQSSVALSREGRKGDAPLRAGDFARAGSLLASRRRTRSRRGRIAIFLGAILSLAVALGIGAGHAEIERATGMAIPGGRIRIAHLTAGSPDQAYWAKAIPQDAAVASARLANAQTPFVAVGLTPARPFVLGTLETNRQRAVDCLAAAAYYEAGLGATDQRAVMQVVLNRLRHPAFPHTVCGVIFQGSELPTGCQFTFTCDRSIDRRRPSPQAWQAARALAGEMLDGRVEPAVGLATHYHTDWVFPDWSRQMDKIAAVQTHLFFRWRGTRGSSAAFSAGYDMVEPRVPLLAGLSAAHQAVGAPALAPTFTAQPEAPPEQDYRGTPAVASLAVSPRERLPDRGEAPDADTFLVALDAAAGADSFLELARKTCSGRSRCRLIGWTNPARKADQFPLPGIAVDAISFTFARRGPPGSDQAQWNCAEFPRSSQSQCLRRGT